MSDAKTFAEVLYGDLREEEFVEVRFIPTKDRDKSVHQEWFSDVDEAVEYALQPPKGYDSYVGVCPRKDRAGGKTAVSRMTAIWADIDSYKDEGRTQEDVIQELKNLVTPPTMVVNSGGGLHVYWLLEEAGEKKPAQRLMRRMAQVLGGDRATSDPARVLRVPGTANTKEERPRMVTLVSLNWKNRYTLDELERTFPTEGFRQPEDRAALQLDEGVLLGHRTMAFIERGELPDDDMPERNHLLGIARNMRSNGYDEDDTKRIVWESLERHMADPCPRCRPSDPWRYEDVDKMVWSIFENDPTTELAPKEPLTFTVKEGGPRTSARLVPATDEDFENRDPELHWIVQEWLLRRDLTFLTGGYGTGKSWLILDLALAIADPERTTWLGLPIEEHGTVFYFDEENDADAIFERMALLGYKGGLLASTFYYFNFSGLRLTDKGWVRELHSLVDDVKPLACFFDTYQRFNLSEENSNDAANIIFLEALAPLSRRYGSSVILLDHPKKNTEGGAIVSRGAYDKIGQVDRAWYLKGKAGDAVVTLDHAKPGRRGKMPPPRRVERVETVGGVQLRGEIESEDSEVQQNHQDADSKALMQALQGGPKTLAELRRETKVAEGTAKRRLAQLAEIGEVAKDEEAKTWSLTATEF